MMIRLRIKNFYMILIDKLRKYQPYLSSGKIDKYEYPTGEEKLPLTNKLITS